MLTRMYLYSTSTKLSIDVWLYLDRPGVFNYMHVFLFLTITDKIRTFGALKLF